MGGDTVVVDWLRRGVVTEREAEQVFVGQQVSKLFGSGGDQYMGNVVSIEKRGHGLAAVVEYEHGVEESVGLEELCGMLLDRDDVEAAVMGRQKGKENEMMDMRKSAGGAPQMKTPVMLNAVVEDGMADLTDAVKSKGKGTAARGKRTRGGGQSNDSLELGRERAAAAAAAAGGGGGGGGSHANKNKDKNKRARTLTGGKGQEKGSGSGKVDKRKRNAQDDESDEDYEPEPLTLEFDGNGGPWRGDGTRGAGLPGHVKRIEVANFMCHKHMTMDFCPHVTFISGTNGSGKSASLQALQCSLGVNATKHGKNAGLAKLIRTGAEEAIVRVTIWNRPTEEYDAYRHEDYGDYITIERRIALKSMSWAFKSASNKIVSRKKEELENILRCLGLNASNPITVMTQNTARGLLGSTTAKADHEKFDLYMDATQLGAIAENITVAKHCLSQMSEHVEKIQEEYSKLEEREANVRARYQQLQRLEDVNREMQDLEVIYAWEIVREQEKLKETFQNSLTNDAVEEIKKATDEIEELSKSVEARKAKLEEKSNFLTSFGSNVDEMSKIKAEIGAEKKECTQKLTLLRKKMERLRNQIEEQLEEKKRLEESLKDFNDAEDASTQATAIKYADDVSKAQQRAKGSREELAYVENEISKKIEDLGQLDAEITNIGMQRNAHRNRFSKLQNEMQQAKACARNKAGRFGTELTMKALDAIETGFKRGEFSMKPIGPIGQYLGLRETKYAAAIEAAIGSHLNTFLVRDKHDFHSLRNIFQKIGMPAREQPKISIMNLNRAMYTISEHEQPRGDVMTVYRSLTCDDQVKAPIMNYLVDMARVEKLALVASYEEQKSVVQDRNVSTVFDLKGARSSHRGQTSTYEWQSRDYERQARLGVSAKQIQSNIQEQIQSCQKVLQELDVSEKTCRDRILQLNRAKTNLEQKKQQCFRSKAEAEAQLETLMTQAEIGTQAEQGSAAEDLSNEIVVATRNITTFEEKLDQLSRDLESETTRKTELETRLGEVIAEMKSLGETNETLVATYSSEKRELNQLQTQLQDAKNHKLVVEGRVNEIKENLEHVQLMYDAALPQAEEICDRATMESKREAMIAKLKTKGLSDDQVDKSMSRSMLEKRLERAAKMIQEAEKEAGGSLQMVEKELIEVQRAVEEDGGEMRNLLDLYKDLKNSYNDRMKKFKEVDESVEKIVTRRFNHYMRKKGHFGRIRVHRKERKLELAVRIGEKGQAPGTGTVKDLKQLSGGERSFATVAFALALGGETEMPFRAMDEFDVFMDSINRRIAMENLLSFARENPNLQFIFLTPQDITALYAAREQCRSQGINIPDDFIDVVQMRPARP